jgi:hypothetical protein
MKTLLLPFALLLLVSFTVSDTKLTDPERLVAMTELTTSHDKLLSDLDGLSEEQLNYKSSPDSWSIAECTEHIAISENNIFGMLKGTLKTPADPSRRGEVKMGDEQILKMIADRSKKLKTQEVMEPTGKFGSHAATVKEFKTKRKASIQYIATTQDDLRNHYAEMPFGVMDAYQVLLFMSAHTDRHIAQIEEIMEDEDFPEE